MRGDRTRRPRPASIVAIAVLMLVTPFSTTARTNEPAADTTASVTDPVTPPKPKIAKLNDVDVREVPTVEFGIETPTGLTYLPNLETLVLATPGERGTQLVGVRTYGDAVGRRFLRGVTARALAPHPTLARLTTFGAGTLTSIAEQDLFGSATVAERNALTLGIATTGGMTAGPDGALYVLDGRQIAAVKTGGALRVTGRTTLGKAVRNPSGLAYNTGDGRMYVGDGTRVRVLEGTGVQTAVFDLSNLGVQSVLGLAFAPSADGTDDPKNVSLFTLADTAAVSHELIEVRLPFQNAETPTDQLRDARGLRRIPGGGTDKEATAQQTSHVTATLVRTIDMTALLDTSGNEAPHGSDTSDIAYDPVENRLIVMDGEIEEQNMCWLYQGVNLFHISLQGEYLGGGTSAENQAPTSTCPAGHTNTPNSKAFSKEPVGGGWFSSADELLITDDDQDDVTWLKPGSDNIYGTGDDTVKEFQDLRQESTGTFMGSTADPESVAYDSTSNIMWITDGLNEEMYRWEPGPDGKFAGQTGTTALLGDDIVTHFDLSIHGIIDPEGMTYDKFSDSLLVVCDKTGLIYRLDKVGNLLETIDVSVTGGEKLGGLAVGPSSVDPEALSYWIADRGIDNGSQGTEPVEQKCVPTRLPDCPDDGKVYEVSTGGISNFQPVVTISTPTDGSNVAATPTTVQFKASATDTEDGDVTASITFTSPGLVGTPTCSMPTPTEKVCELKLNPGVQTVTARATDSINVFGIKTISLYVGPGPFQVQVPIVAGSDDAEQRPSSAGSTSNSVRLTDSTLEMTDAGSGRIQTLGFRFAPPVPQGSFVESAYVQFTANSSNSGPTAFQIQAQASDNAAPFSSAQNNLTDTTLRPRVSKDGNPVSIAWAPGAWATGAVGAEQKTPNLWPLLDPIFQRANWRKGNSLALFIDGTGLRVAKSLEGGAPPRLTINFQFTPFPPDVTITSPANNASLPIGRTVSLTGTAISRTEGAVSDRLQWTSDIDGPLGTGASISRVLSVAPDNSPRTHVITARATDDANQTGTASVTVTIQNQAPVVRIDAPANNSAHASTTQIQFVGSALDPDDGNLSYLLIWRSSMNGLIGRGSMVRKQLSTGVHIISLEVTDRFGVKSTSTITIQVGAGAPPSVSIASPNNAAYPSGSKVTIGGTATDPEQGNLTGTIKWTSNIDGTLGTGGTATAFLTQGTHTITAKVTDNTGQTSTASIQLSMTPGVSVADVPIASALDDAEQFTIGAMRLSSGELNMTSDMGRSQVVGLRYALPVPKGATITEAWVQFTASASDGGAPTLIIECQASDNAPAFTSAWKNITSRTRMAGYVTWNPSPWTAGQHDLAQRTPSLVPLLQKVVSRPGWQAGNATVLIISGSGARTAESFERGLAPILHVDWQ